MTIYKITHRYYYGEKPHECNDHTEAYVATLDFAHEFVKTILGEDAKCDDNWGLFESWTAPHLPRIEYLIDPVRVLEDKDNV